MSYATHGAACISVLTDKLFFQGNLQHIKEVRNVCELPILQKDFIIDFYQIYKTRL